MRETALATIARFTFVLLCSIVFMHWNSFAAFAEPDDLSHLLFIPLVTNSPTAVSDTTYPACQFNAQEEAMASLFQQHPAQEHTAFRCEPILSAVARARAEDMGRRHYFDHISPEGQGANDLVSEAGYRLPDYYGRELASNNIESIGAGAQEAEAMWEAWMQSDKHRAHLLGENDFFREQTDYGIGFARVPGSDYEFYWVFLSAKPAGSH